MCIYIYIYIYIHIRMYACNIYIYIYALREYREDVVGELGANIIQGKAPSIYCGRKSLYD